MIKTNIDKNKNLIIVFIFSLILIIGTLVVDDYGVSSDESDQRHIPGH